MADGPKRAYSRAEAEEIFRRAAARAQSDDDERHAIHHEELVQAAREVGLDPSAIDDVAKAVEAERGELVKAREHDEIVAAHLSRRRRGFARHAVVFGVIASFLAALDSMLVPGWWVQYPLMVWGVFLSLHASTLLFRPDEVERERIVKREEKRRSRRKRREDRQKAQRVFVDNLRKQAAHAEALFEERKKKSERESAQRREQSERMRRAEREFEQAVEQGVATLLGQLAQRIDRAIQPAPETEFGRYVERARRAGTAASSSPKPTETARRATDRARIDLEPVDAEDEVEEEAEADRARRMRR